MASNLSTPESVLSAPLPSRQVVSAQLGMTRRERRQGGVQIPPDLTKRERASLLVSIRRAGKNRPYVKVDPSRTTAAWSSEQ